MRTVRDALAPLVEALSRRVGSDTEAIRAKAEEEAAEVVAAARQEARTILADARAGGTAQARANAAAEHVRAERRARGIELTAQREALEELRARAAAAVRTLRDDPCYPRLLDRLSVLTRAAGGADMVVSEHPGGGVLAEGQGRRVDCSLDALSIRAVDALGAEVERLWAP